MCVGAYAGTCAGACASSFHPYIIPEVEGLDGERLAVTLWDGWHLRCESISECARYLQCVGGARDVPVLVTPLHGHEHRLDVVPAWG